MSQTAASTVSGVAVAITNPSPGVAYAVVGLNVRKHRIATRR